MKAVDNPTVYVYIVYMAALLGTFEQIVLLAVLATGEEAYGRAVLRTVQANLGRTAAFPPARCMPRWTGWKPRGWSVRVLKREPRRAAGGRGGFTG